MALGTTVRCATITLPGVRRGPENPLPGLRPPGRVHTLDGREGLPPDMARQVGHAPLRSVLPCRMLDAYGRDRSTRQLDSIVLENERLRATVLPGLGGRLYSLFHKPTGRELLYRNPVFQPANLGLTGAWFSGGVEWNIGATGHTTLTCAPLHAARLPAPGTGGAGGAGGAGSGGGEMLRMWEWERLRDLPFQIDLWLPDRSDFLYVGVRIRNPHDREVPTYWWSNTAVPEAEGTRVLTPATEAWHFGYERALRRVPVPEWDGLDRTYSTRADRSADYFYELPDGERRWIAALDADGHGLVQTSTDLLRGRKLFHWGTGRGGRRWQEWLTEPGTGGYLEIQAGLARTQLEHVPLEAGGDLSWVEAYGPLAADPSAVHGEDWAAARAEAGRRLEAALPRADVDAAYAAWLPHADTVPKDVLAAGSGWGGLEVAHGGYDLPGTPFGGSGPDRDTYSPDSYSPDAYGPAQRPWLDLLNVGGMREARPEEPPGPSLVAPHWRDLLETAAPTWLTEYHLGVAAWHAGDRAQAVRAWERSMDRGESAWALRCLAVADLESGARERAAQRLLDAVGLIDRAVFHAPVTTEPSVALSALAREAVEALLAADRVEDARDVLDRLPEAIRRKGRFLLLHARTLLASGDAVAAKEVFDTGFEVEDLREGELTLEEVWYAVADRLVAGEGEGAVTGDVRARARAEHPLPPRYDFRMAPG